jgi:hypothetical protein
MRRPSSTKTRAKARAHPARVVRFVVVALVVTSVAVAHDGADATDALLRGTHAIDARALEDANAFVDVAIARALDVRASRGERLRALSVLAAAAHPSADTSLARLIDDADVEVRRVARQVQYHRAPPALRRVLLDEMKTDVDPRIREFAVDQFAREGSLPVLRAIANDDVDPIVRARASGRMAQFLSRAGRARTPLDDSVSEAKPLSR